jgi:hypothetical protein
MRRYIHRPFEVAMRAMTKRLFLLAFCQENGGINESRTQHARQLSAFCHLFVAVP